MTRRLSATVSAALAAGLLSAAPAPAAAPSVSVSPTAVKRGGTLIVTGRHWAPRSRVELLIGPPRSEASHVAWATASTAGIVRARIPIARHAHTGRFVLLACRRSCRIKAQASFRITH